MNYTCTSHLTCLLSDACCILTEPFLYWVVMVQFDDDFNTFQCIMKLQPREFVSRLGQQITCVLRVFSIRNISFTLLFFSLISFHTLFIMICKWYQFPYIFRRRFTNTHIHTHTHLCQPCSVKAPPRLR